MTAAVTALPRRVSPTTTATINAQAALAAAYPLDDNPMLDAAVRQVGIALMADLGYSLDPHEVHDCFVTLVDLDQQLRDLDDNPDEFLASLRLPQTTEQALRVESDLRSDRQSALDRLLDLS